MENQHPLDIARELPSGVTAKSAISMYAIMCENKTTQEHMLPVDVWLDLGIQWVAIDAVTAQANWEAIDLEIYLDEQIIQNPKQFTITPRDFKMYCVGGNEFQGQVTGVALYIPPLPPGIHEVRWTQIFTADVYDGWSLTPKGTVAKATSRLHIGGPDLTLKQAKALLQQVGLDAILTASDDPCLWAAALIWYQKGTDDLDYYPAGLEFGLGRRPTDQELHDPAGQSTGLYGMLDLARYIFEKDINTGKISVQPYDPSTSSAVSLTSLLSFPSLIANPFDQSQSLPIVKLAPSSFLHITRPSSSVDEAWVHDGYVAGPLAGRGQTLLWKRLADGRWVETSHIISSWIS